MIKIEKGIPIPEKRGKFKADTLPWKEMEIGDSFVFEGKSSGFLRKAATKAGIEIVIRGIDIEVTKWGGRVSHRFRVWRVA